MKPEARMSIEPVAHLGMLMRAVIIEHDVDDLADRRLALDRIEKPDELLIPVGLHAAVQ